MAKLARDVMTPDPACCSPDTALDQVAKMMVQNDCGEIPVIDSSDHPIGVVTDRDIVCRIVAESKNPGAYPAEHCMTSPVVTVSVDATIDDVMTTLEDHQLRRVVVVDNDGACVGIIAQADVAGKESPERTAELVRDVSRKTDQSSR